MIPEHDFATLAILAEELVIVGQDGIAHTDAKIREAGLALRKSATFRTLVDKAEADDGNAES
jgi:hypothetical protein